MKNIILLSLILTNLFSYEIYKEIKINNADSQIISNLNQLQIDLDHVHLEKDNSIQFAISESDLLKITSINYIDRILGFIFGVLRVYILLLIAFAILILPLESTDRPNYIKVSNISPIIEKSVNLTLNNIPQLKYYISRGQETSSEIINPEENGINKNE